MSASSGLRINGYQRPVHLIEDMQRVRPAKSKPGAKGKSFNDMFSRELAASNRIEFSKHAHERLHSRGITLSDENLRVLSGALDKAAAKGSRETLILTDEAAFVASVKNRTIITVFDRDQLNNGVVTSIDSAVIM